MICIQNQCSSVCTAEHIGIHTIHLHHILHPAAFFGQSHHRRNTFIFQFFHFHIQLFIVQCFFEGCCQLIGHFFQICAIFFEVFRQICIDTLEFYIFMFLFYMGNKSSINIMFQDYCIHSLFFKHIDVLALLYFVRYIINCCFFRFLLFCLFSVFFLFFWFPGFCCFCFRFFIFFDAVFQCQIFAIQIFKQDIIIHLIREFCIFDASEFDKRADVIPVFLIIFSGCLAHTGQFVSNFLADIIRDFFDKSIVLQCASRYVQWQIRTVDHTF